MNVTSANRPALRSSGFLSPTSGAPSAAPLPSAPVAAATPPSPWQALVAGISRALAAFVLWVEGLFGGAGRTAPPSTAPPSVPAGTSPVPAATGGPVQVGVLFGDQLSPALVKATAPRVGLVWAGDNVAAWHAVNPKTLVGAYVPGHRDPDARRNLAWWLANHPDWIVYRKDGSVAYECGDPNVPLAWWKPEVQQWLIQNYVIPAEQQGYDMVSLDNIDQTNDFGEYGTKDASGNLVPAFTGDRVDPKFEAAQVQYLTAMARACHSRPRPMLLSANFWYPNQDASVIAPVDVILDQQGFTKNPSVAHIQLIQQLQEEGKTVLVDNENPGVPTAQQRTYDLAAYLLSAEGRSYQYTTQTNYYSAEPLDPAYEAPLGAPSGQMYAVGGAYGRDFAHGKVLLNPSTTATVTIPLPAGQAFQDLSGNPVAQVTMPPLSGEVLLDRGG